MPHEIQNKKMQMFFKKITKIKRAKKMIYITEFGEIPLEFPTDWGGERLNGGPKAEMLAHT